MPGRTAYGFPVDFENSEMLRRAVAHLGPSLPLLTTNFMHSLAGTWSAIWVSHALGADALTAVGNAVYLFWTDPLGASDNDYDLYILNSAGTSITGGSTNAQDGTQDPVEGTTATLTANSRIVVVKFAGADRYLHLNTNRGRLSINTNGQTKGHSAVPAAFSVAATPAADSSAARSQ